MIQRGLARSSHVFVLFGSLLVFGACAVDGGELGEAGDDASTSADENGDDSQLEPTLARGISIDEVEINQGTRIPIGHGGDWLDGSERLGYVIASRDSLLRVHYSVDEDWIPREIEVRLSLGFPDGSTKVLSETRFIEESSTPYSLPGTFWFGLIADQGQTVAGTTYQVELWETEGGAGAELDEGLPANPADGPELIGFEAVPMQIKLVLVPIEYNGVVPDLSEEVQAEVVNNLYEQNPATEVLWDVHEPVPYDSNLTSLGSLLPVMAQLRTAEAADPNVYYHALVDIGSSTLGGVLGISNIANDKKTDAGSRVSATVLWSVNPSLGADTFTHETGHAQGLFHVECPMGGAARPDPAYPHANGRIGNWGFGIRRYLMFDPDDAFDYMSYCSPSWVSEWTWNKTYKRIKTLTSWDFEGAAGTAQPPAQLLVGAIYSDGSREWWTMPGEFDPEGVSGRDRFEFETAEGELVEAWGELELLSDGETQWVRAVLPAAPAQLRAITHFRDDQAAAIDPAELGIDFAVASDWSPSF